MGANAMKQLNCCGNSSTQREPDATTRLNAKLGSSGTGGFHSMMRSRPGVFSDSGPGLAEYILIPWLCAVIILTITIVAKGSSWLWVILPSLLLCGACGTLSLTKYKQSLIDARNLHPDDRAVSGQQSMAIFYLLCLMAGFSAFVVSIIANAYFLNSYHKLSGGATYFDMLPSQSGMSASDATAIVFAHGTSVDQSRTYGYIDGRRRGGTMYCVAPVADSWTRAEAGVQFFAAGTNCCGRRTGFGCGEGLGALVLAREEDADSGFRAAVDGAAAAYGLQPGRGYLLLRMVADPLAYRNDKMDNAVKLLLIYGLVYLMISCVCGYMAHNSANK